MQEVGLEERGGTADRRESEDYVSSGWCWENVPMDGRWSLEGPDKEVGADNAIATINIDTSQRQTGGERRYGRRHRIGVSSPFGRNTA